ncbi:ubiquitin carboxyl-terminal hydrolase 47-like [Mytilus galloprovincialis]|uniref:ubiquitin carboxyl-terminal hydrolase 47-like n=1 Tax=Mytilus galloprovincialis TaxID=29158 RepID=UPI003F7CAB87
MPKQIDEQKNENISQLKGVTSGNKCKGNSKILKDKEQHEKWLEMDKLRWKNVCVAEEPRILCVIRDMIDPNTAGSKKTVNLPASTSIGDVIDEISKLTRYIASSINIKYNKQVAAELEEISLYACANQKLSDICMLGTRRHEFTVVEKEDTIPQKLSEITPAPDPPNYDGIAYTSSSYISGSTPAKETVSKYPDSTA